MILTISDLMRVQYKGISLAGADATPVAVSGATLWTWDAVFTASAAATIIGANSVVMANLVAGVPFQLPGISHEEWGDEPQIELSQYSITAAAGQTVRVAYSERRGVS